jgi:diaminopimelate decarboxylase
MNQFHYGEHALYCEGIALAEIAARVGTPCYVYSAEAILANFRAYDQSFGAMPHTICYAVKANGNLAVLRLLAEAGAGFDIVSGGELFRVLQAGGNPSKVVFSGVGKTAAEIDEALAAGIFNFNCESEPELALIDALAHRRGVKARVALRVNPDVETDTHDYISTGKLAHKFGVDIAEAEGIYQRARKHENLLLEGVSCHIGSLLLDPGPLMEAVDRVLALIERMRANGLNIRHADLGGGLGVAYKPDEVTPSIETFVTGLKQRLEGRNLHAVLEPGRSIVAAAGVLLTKTLYRKKTGEKEFIIVDAAMNDLIRPALYGAYHDILPVRQNNNRRIRADVVGPVCETGDFLARDREMSDAMPGDVLAISTAGAYGFAQASTYNARRRPAEVMVEGDRWRVVRTRESYEDLIRGESI